MILFGFLKSRDLFVKYIYTFSLKNLLKIQPWSDSKVFWSTESSQCNLLNWSSPILMYVPLGLADQTFLMFFGWKFVAIMIVPYWFWENPYWFWEGIRSNARQRAVKRVFLKDLTHRLEICRTNSAHVLLWPAVK